MTTVPAVLDGLFALVGSALPGVQRVFGQPLPNLRQDFVVIGWNDEEPAVTFDETYTNLAGKGSQESYVVANQIVSWRGNAEKIHDAFVTVYANLALLETALDVDHTLSGAAPGGYVSSTASNLRLFQRENGPMAVLDWSVQVTAFRR